ncbi:P-loop containing nucleoside triphosphate hydrolase protein [Amylostereum chailletii]|nr:P-loop containing nucleoside triphosphate hydrolase protein [Amylostereum chailletii]
MVNSIPTPDVIRARTLEVFRKSLCHLQIQVCQGILQRKKNIVCSAATGFGKSLTFMMPLLFDDKSIIVVVTALNILGGQTVETLAKEIREGRHRLVVVNPEVMMEHDGHFDRLWKNKAFTDRLPSLVSDEAHCISVWGGFRPEYREISRLRYLLPSSVHYCLLSATLSPPVLDNISEVLNLNASNTVSFLRQND